MHSPLPSLSLSPPPPPTSNLSTLHHAMQLHAQMLKTNYHGHAPASAVASILTLSSSTNLSYARSVFDSVPDHPTSFLSNTMIRAYARSPQPSQAILFFIELQHRNSPVPDRFTFPFLLAACSRLQSPSPGKQLHALILKAGAALASDRYINNSLVHMYSACKHLDCAAMVFDRMTDRDVVSWTTIINGTVDADRPVEALQLFGEMENQGVAPNAATAVSVLRACADAGALSIGRRVHRIVEERGIGAEVNVATALIDMYAKCGCVDAALRMFHEMPDGKKDVFAWTAMISGLGNHGRCGDALDLFDRMVEQSRVEPDDRTITAVLCACRSAGWVAKGYRYYNNMHRYGGMRPRIQHYGCMVDLLARAGHLDEAEGFMRRMPVEPDAVLWRTLIWACKLHDDTERAERLMNEWKLLDDAQEDTSLAPREYISDSGSYVLMGNIYASAGRWQEKARIRELMVRRRIGKLPGCSRIEVRGVIHEFGAGDSAHPEAERIYAKLDEILEKLRVEAGYRPRASEVLLDMEDEEKACQVQHHSEKLAVAFGLIDVSPEEEILVVKNLRSCEDCHTAMKLVSRVYNRRIIIRDRIKFHHFSNGLCSCGDYW